LNKYTVYIYNREEPTTAGRPEELGTPVAPTSVENEATVKVYP
jgi:hypothetical protein